MTANQGSPEDAGCGCGGQCYKRPEEATRVVECDRGDRYVHGLGDGLTDA